MAVFYSYDCLQALRHTRQDFECIVSQCFPTLLAKLQTTSFCSLHHLCQPSGPKWTTDFQSGSDLDRLCWPIQQFDPQSTEKGSSFTNGMFWVIVLKNKVILQTNLCRDFSKFSLMISMYMSAVIILSIWTDFPDLTMRNTPTLPSPCLSPFFRYFYPKVFRRFWPNRSCCLWWNRSNLISSLQRTFFQKSTSLSTYFLTNSRRLILLAFGSKDDVAQNCSQPFRSFLCMVRSEMFSWMFSRITRLITDGFFFGIFSRIILRSSIKFVFRPRPILSATVSSS